MENHKYAPIILSTYLNKFGYWVVIYSVAPGRRMSTTICREGATPAQVRAAADATLAHINA